MIEWHQRQKHTKTRERGAPPPLAALSPAADLPDAPRWAGYVHRADWQRGKGQQGGFVSWSHRTMQDGFLLLRIECRQSFSKGFSTEASLGIAADIVVKDPVQTEGDEQQVQLRPRHCSRTFSKGFSTEKDAWEVKAPVQALTLQPRI